MEDGIVRTVIVMEDLSVGWVDHITAEVVAIRAVYDGFTGQKSWHVVADDVMLGEKLISENFVFDMAVGKDGKFVSAPSVSGDLDLDLTKFWM